PDEVPPLPAPWCSLCRRLLDDFLERGRTTRNLLHPIHAQRQHAFLETLLTQLVRRRTVHDQASQLGRHRHDLVETRAPLVAAAGALVAALAAIERQLSFLTLHTGGIEEV